MNRKPKSEESKQRSRHLRLVVAKEFILSIPLGSRESEQSGEIEVVKNGPTPHSGETASTDPLPPGSDQTSNQHAEVGPKRRDTQGLVRLDGSQFRHFTSLGNRENTAFETLLVTEKVLDSRVMFSSSRQYPVSMLSIKKYNPRSEQAQISNRQTIADTLLKNIFTTQHRMRYGGGSRKHRNPLLVPEYRKAFISYSLPRNRYSGKSDSDLDNIQEDMDDLAGVDGIEGMTDTLGDYSVGESGPIPSRLFAKMYNPRRGLDDPAIDLDKRRQKYNGEGYTMSIIPFWTERVSKDEINRQFAEANPWLDTGDNLSLTLSKIRSLKRRALELWWSNKGELSTIALAITCFDRLVYQRLVNKTNRKIAFATCLLLAFKMNESRETHKDIVSKWLIPNLEKAFSVNRKDLLDAEFIVFARLSFSLHVPAEMVEPHFDRLLTQKGITQQEFLQSRR